MNSPFPSSGLPLCQKRVFTQNFLYENEFDLHENELVGEAHFNKNSITLRLVLTQRQTRTWKWAIVCSKL